MISHNHCIKTNYEFLCIYMVYMSSNVVDIQSLSSWFLQDLEEQEQDVRCSSPQRLWEQSWWLSTALPPAVCSDTRACPSISPLHGIRRTHHAGQWVLVNWNLDLCLHRPPLMLFHHHLSSDISLSHVFFFFFHIPYPYPSQMRPYTGVLLKPRGETLAWLWLTGQLLSPLYFEHLMLLCLRCRGV